MCQSRRSHGSQSNHMSVFNLTLKLRQREIPQGLLLLLSPRLAQPGGLLRSRHMDWILPQDSRLLQVAPDLTRDGMGRALECVEGGMCAPLTEELSQHGNPAPLRSGAAAISSKEIGPGKSADFSRPGQHRRSCQEGH